MSDVDYTGTGKYSTVLATGIVDVLHDCINRVRVLSCEAGFQFVCVSKL